MDADICFYGLFALCLILIINRYERMWSILDFSRSLPVGEKCVLELFATLNADSLGETPSPTSFDAQIKLFVCYLLWLLWHVVALLVFSCYFSLFGIQHFLRSWLPFLLSLFHWLSVFRVFWTAYKRTKPCNGTAHALVYLSCRLGWTPIQAVEKKIHTVEMKIQTVEMKIHTVEATRNWTVGRCGRYVVDCLCMYCWLCVY